MIRVTHETQIWIATRPADFRCGIDGLGALCRKLNQDPRSGSVFVFVNRRKTMVRLLVYEMNGFWLLSKRLSQGKFSWPNSNEDLTPLVAKHLMNLLKSES